MATSGETIGARSSGMSYQDLLDIDTREVPQVLRWSGTGALSDVRVPRARYISQEWFDLEVEHLWKKVWQFACREEEIPEVGDHEIYEIADQSLIIVRTAPDEIRAFHNACLHRGRRLRDEGGRVSEFRCPFHGWTWKLDGELSHVTCRWDLPHVTKDEYQLPEAKVGTWGGFVFVNMDPDCEPLEDFLGDLPSHFEQWPLEKRYKEAHVAKVLDCNWKVAQDAFMEAYHVVATHPQLLSGLADSNSQYDVWGNFSRAMTGNAAPSPHIDYQPDEQEILDTIVDRSLDVEPMLRVAEGGTARATFAQVVRMGFGGAIPSVQDVSDAELVDNFYYTLFPNFHPWGAYNRIVYRFRPWRTDPHRCVMEVIFLSPFRGRRPKPAKVHWLAEDEDWTCAPELGFLARVFNQDTFNLPNVQKGLRASVVPNLTLTNYQETKLRHFHGLLERWVGS